MKRHPSLVPYSQDHHKILVLAQVLKNDTPDYKGMPADVDGKVKMARNYFQEIILPHEQREEKYLFPVIKNKDSSIDALLIELIREHDEMGQLIQALGQDTISEYQLNELGLKLEKHVRKEERVLFQLVQEKLGEEILSQITA